MEWQPYGKTRPADLLTTLATDVFWGVLGVHCGQFWDPIEARKANSKNEHEPIREGDKLLIQSGMTIVIPAQRIIELLNLEPLEMDVKSATATDNEFSKEKPVRGTIAENYVP